jgi:hypothetical protein
MRMTANLIGSIDHEFKYYIELYTNGYKTIAASDDLQMARRILETELCIKYHDKWYISPMGNYTLIGETDYDIGRIIYYNTKGHRKTVN